MIRQHSRKILLSAAIAAMAAGFSAPAAAGGYHGGYYSVGYGGHYYGHGRHYHHRRYHRRHGHGGKGALIALGVIGGAIILNEAAEARARERAYERAYEARYRDRYNRYDRYARRSVPRYEEQYPQDYRGDAESGLEDSGLDNGSLSDDLEPRLDGGPEPIRLTYADAYSACTQHARTALSNRGFILAAPAAPDTAEDVGGSWKMTATVTAQRGDESWSRAMYCEADDRRVYLLELI